MEKQENILINLLFNIIVPAVVLSKLAGYVPIEPYQVLLIALAFPVSYAVYDFYERKKINAISVLGFASILLTGVIGLLDLEKPTIWIAVKEATIPLAIGIFVLISNRTKSPLVKTFVYSENILDVHKIDAILQENGKKAELDKILDLSSVFLAASFFVSATLNFVLATILIKSPTGTVAFNEELGRMIALSYPVIALPSTLIIIGIIWSLFRNLKQLTGLTTDELFAEKLREK
ncbi:MAG: hypothetical protein LBR75_03520 [Prevotellaceae bacterium]|jgi:hypothetical protein|nr:hypothetical protein [Prevotellaceae bacterium]